jgi:hypothetical protein
VVYIGKQKTMLLEAFLTVFTAIAVSSGGNFPLAALRRYFVEEARRVPEIGALEPFWGGIGTGATAIFFYVVEHPQLTLPQVAAVTGALIVPTVIAGLPTYYAARGEWRGLVKASLPVVVALPALVLAQTALYRITGLSSAVVSAIAGVGFTLLLVAGWGTAIRKGLLRSTTRDIAAERVSSLEAALEEERKVLGQLVTASEQMRRSRTEQLRELRDAEARIAELEGTVYELEQARLEVSQLTSALETAHTIRDEQLLAARELREENSRLRAQLEQRDSDES